MEIGQEYDISKLLATPERDYLVRNNGDKVNVKDIKGKTIGMYFVALDREPHSGQYSCTEDLKSCYRLRDDFEVVFVALVRDEDVDSELFDNCFSKMPWLAIPYHDKESRKCLKKYCGSYCLPVCIFLGPNGRVISRGSPSLLCDYGPPGYPFTKERIDEIDEEDSSIFERDSIVCWLTSPSRDFLINNKDEKVPVSDLVGKVVGLYFYSRSCCNAKEVVKIYQALKDRGEENFEIVVINRYQREKEEKAFEEDFKSMPWLAWPLSDQSYLRLERFFGHTGGKLIIVDGPNMDYTDEYGMDVLAQYGIDAYPFTRRGAAVSEMKKLKEHSLQKILASLGDEFLIGKDGLKVQLSEVQGKSICLFVATLSSKACNVILDKLIGWYDQIKKKDDTFEVIYVSWDNDEGEKDTYKESYAKMPWLVSPFRRKKTRHDLSLWNVFKAYNLMLPLLYAFGKDGKILTQRAWQKLKRGGVAAAYPFDDNELEDEILYEVNLQNAWPTRDV